MPYKNLVLCGIVACFDVLNLPDNESESPSGFTLAYLQQRELCGGARACRIPLGQEGISGGCAACPFPSAKSSWLLSDLNGGRFLREITPWDCNFCHKEVALGCV